jgi:hypothetical protein
VSREPSNPDVAYSSKLWNSWSSTLAPLVVKHFLIHAFLGGLWTLAGVAYADTEYRIPGYSSYVESKNGTVLCGEEYTSYHESRTGRVCAGGQYTSYHESSTGEVACGGQYTSYHESSTGKVFFGGLYRPSL